MLLVAVLWAGFGGISNGAAAQDRLSAQEARPSAADTVNLSLQEALHVALDESYSLESVRFDVRNAQQQVRETRGQLYPNLSASGSYMRNVVTANPFAGSDVAGLFGGGASTDWVAFNERARQDGDPATSPITYQRFQERQRAAQREAGILSAGGGGNPFGVANQFQTGLSVQQTVFNMQAFSALDGAQALLRRNQLNLDREQQATVGRVREQYYRVLLAQARADVARESVSRAERTLDEIARQVQAGTLPKAERLAADVQLANRRTQLVEAKNSFGLARDNLKMTLGVPVGQPIAIDGELSARGVGEYADVDMQKAVQVAIDRRPDLEGARLQVDLNEIRKHTTKVQYLPTVSAVADFGLSGRVPSDRTTSYMPDPTDPFRYATETNTFLSDQYWNPSLSVGLQLSWNLFTGFQRAARIEQQEVAINRAEMQREQLRQQVQLEVQRAMRNLRAARQRIEAQSENVETAETNYDYAQQRLETGVSNQLQVREASAQLDQARISYLQAVSDYLTAKSALEVALGAPFAAESDIGQPAP